MNFKAGVAARNEAVTKLEGIGIMSITVPIDFLRGEKHLSIKSRQS